LKVYELGLSRVLMTVDIFIFFRGAPVGARWRHIEIAFSSFTQSLIKLIFHPCCFWGGGKKAWRSERAQRQHARLRRKFE
ncbi:hypothetical protein PFISCL1PPCAC_19873, partial [Pristionchus fissidentatus]